MSRAAARRKHGRVAPAVSTGQIFVFSAPGDKWIKDSAIFLLFCGERSELPVYSVHHQMHSNPAAFLMQRAVGGAVVLSGKLYPLISFVDIVRCTHWELILY